MERETTPGRWITTDVPPRLDALAWSPWHRRVVLALGITWILDGLEASLIANLAPSLRDPRTLGLTGAQVGLANSAYLIGQVLGALFFGYLTDRLGRKRLFLVTLSLYLAATGLGGLSPGFGVFLVFRLLAGAGIGGEYAAINSAIDELIPARVRGHVDLAINGSYWVGVALGAGLTVVLLDPARLPLSIAWRLAFGLGSVLGLAIVLVRHDVPESPRWLLAHGREGEAAATMEQIEAKVYAGRPPPPPGPVRVQVHGSIGARALARALLGPYRRRALLGATLMLAQAFFYNAIFFSYGLILERFHGVPAADVGLYTVPFAVGNFLGPLLLGGLFDRWGRRPMIAGTYALSGALLLATGGLFVAGALDARTQTLAWSLVFFFASAAASAAYLTVSELFPVELRGLAIALFYAFATLLGASAPALFGAIVDSGRPLNLLAGYALASALMLAAAVVGWRLGFDAEGRSLEQIREHHEPG